ncbi:MAG: ABC transporter [Chloroflexi bacterium]|nr:ABC transporter [Chloroflexota bacterium]
MHLTALFKALGPVDLRNVRRDPLLLWIPIYPLFLALVYRFGVPALATVARGYWGIELQALYPLFMSLFLVFTPGVAGMVVGFLLLDERDDGILTAHLVTPVPWTTYLAYRLSVPVLLGLVMTLSSYPLAGLVPLGFGPLLAVTLLGSLAAPLVALFLGALAENKVSGFAMVKILNILLVLPLAAYFFTSPWRYLAGLVPTFWPLQAYWSAATGQPYGLYLVGGAVVNVAALALLLRRFDTVAHR